MEIEREDGGEPQNLVLNPQGEYSKRRGRQTLELRGALNPRGEEEKGEKGEELHDDANKPTGFSQKLATTKIQ